MKINKKVLGIIIAALVAGTISACSLENSIKELPGQNTTAVEEAENADHEYSLTDGEDITIEAAGTYLISGQAENVTIYVDSDDEDEVTIILSDASISNDDRSCIYVNNAKEVLVVTAAGTENTLTVTDEFAEDDNNGDAVVYSRDDLVLAGEGTLIISSLDNAIRSNDDILVQSGTYVIDCEKNAFRANEDIEIDGGTITVKSCNDGIHAENDDDDTKGSILISAGNIDITAEDDAIHATTTIQIDDGTIILTAAEGIEATQIAINGGEINITASDDGINAARKSSSMTPEFTLNAGNMVISMGQGDTDGVDSNGNIYINGGTIDITGQSTFDYDGEAEYNGGTIIENGEETNTISNQFFGGQGGMPGGMGGGFKGGSDNGFENKGDSENGFEGGRGGMLPPGSDGKMNPDDFKGNAPDGPGGAAQNGEDSSDL
ncbi:carbohydrate-binding domain-containing protein [Butyrivibrio sp. MC2013]|uniref:carbohydrate-binding domain-containing protein n=1 Tax=Butyrivibrio sp. MC2013 TaxID=1280686 RepID=UPI000414CA00|nr:carbohydrate-binding domain-containing protein [Butyrivibrio sp. MC2013]